MLRHNNVRVEPQEIGAARKQDALRLQSAEERFELVVSRLDDLERAFTRTAVTENTPTLEAHQVLQVISRAQHQSMAACCLFAVLESPHHHFHSAGGC